MLLCAGPALALAQNVEPIRLAFQQPLQDKGVSDLTVELGGYDVTHFAELEGREGVVVRLPNVLEPGQYRADVRVFYEDGEVQTLVEQLITVTAPAGVAWQANATLSPSYRYAERETADFVPYDHLHTTAGLQANAAVTGAVYDVHAGIQTLYDTNSLVSANGEEAQLVGYQAGITRRFEQGRAGLHAGDTRITQESLLFSNYQRRGTSLRGESADGTLQATAFTVLSDVTTSFEDDLVWPRERNERTTGATFAVHPWAQTPERLVLGVGYVDGQGTASGSGFTVADPETVYGGDAWNVSAASTLLEGAVRGYLEWAESSFDSDGLGLGEGARDDDAWKALLQFGTDGGRLPQLGLDRWSLTLEQQNVGTDFYSIANLALPGDLDARRASLAGNRGGFGFLAEWAHQENNESGDPTRATLEIDLAGFEASYTPAVNPSAGPWTALGVPTLSLAWRETQTAQQPGGELLTGIDVDQRNRDLVVGASFTRQALTWTLTHAVTEVDDDSLPVFQNGVQTHTPQPDNENHLTTLQLSWYAGPRVTLSPYAQWSRYEEPLVGNRYETTNAGLEGRFVLLPGRLTLDMNYLRSVNDYSFGTPGLVDTDLDSDTGNFQLVWKAVRATPDRPGTDLYLNGSYGRQESNGMDSETWQVRAGLSVYWAASRP